MHRLGKNQGRYCGESIDIQQTLRAIQAEALKTGWRSECFLETPEISLRSYHRPARDPALRLYISSGIHGDEPAGPLAILKLLQDDRWPGRVEVWICPCLNPSGFPLNQRENAGGIDLNRDYRHLVSAEIRAHVAWLERQPAFDLTLILHEDWEASGFYLYELNPDGLPSFSESIIQAVGLVCPIESSLLVDNWPASAGIIRPKVRPEDRPQWPEAIYLISKKTRQSYTLEAPSDFPLSTRVSALRAAVRNVLDTLSPIEVNPSSPPFP